jgi:integrase
MKRRDRNNPELERKLLEYRQWARTYGGYHASSTIPKQVRTIRRFGEVCNIMNLKESMEKILDELVKESDRGVLPQTLNHLSYDIEAWSRFLGEEIHIPRFKQSKNADPWIPTDEDVEKIRKAAGTFGNRTENSRNTCLIDLLFAGGMRIGELIRINLEDLEGNLLTIRSEKGEKPRVIGLPQSLATRLHEYIRLYRTNSDPRSLFTSSRGKMEYNWCRNLIKIIAKKAGVPKFHAHAARHWCATALLRNSRGSGLDIREIQIHLGHASLSSTQIYTHLTDREVASRTSDKMEQIFSENQVHEKHSSSNPKKTELALYGTAEI